MADALLSGSLQLLFNRLGSPELINFSHELLNKLKRKLLVVHKALSDAEMKQFSDPLVKEWLVQVKDAVYHVEDLLDEIVTIALQRQIEAADSHTGRISTSVDPSFADQSMESRVMGLITILEKIEQRGVLLGLKEGEDKKLSPRSPSSSLVDESVVYGREEIKEEMLQWLLSGEKIAADNNADVMSIVGIGGSGKTTLAQLLYNHEKVIQHFQLKAWVCVSTEIFLLEEVTKSVLSEVGCTTNSDDSLDLLLLKLKQSVGNQRFLLVLDDVWDMRSLDWDGLRIPLLTAAEGSKIVVTSRSETAARIMEAVRTHHLEKLGPEDSWSLFTKFAFPNGDANAYPLLEPIGRRIVHKCQGLPLAVKALGSLLHSKTEEKEWEGILNSNTWHSQLDQEILPSLALSYQHLSPPAKRCFAYCSIFPKDHEFDKQTLILLWMAEGLLDVGQGDERMEDVGESCFNELLSKLLFQKSSRKQSCFVMHDVIHDLAQHISGECCVCLEDDKVQKVTDKARHFLYYKGDIDQMVLFKNFEAVGEVQHLRTFFHIKRFSFFIIYILSQRVLQDTLPKFKYLRVLSLSHYRITNVPDSIHNLKHLRYLDLSFTRIRKLPESICFLCNLQTLILSGCHFLLELPLKMGKLINLRYLDVTGVFQMKEMPHGIHQLKSLQQFPCVIVGKESGFGIGGLRGLSEIRGVLQILKMENVVLVEDAMQANMKDKRYIEELSLNWDGRISNGVTESVAVDDILDKLQPHPNLKQFSLINYPGVTFPDWLGDPSFLNLGSLKLSGCGNCSTLPPLGQLPCLKHLEISKMKGVVRVGSEFYGNSASLHHHHHHHHPSFSSLQTLSFEDMLNWETWLCCGDRHEEFPCLQKLNIKLCPKFTGELPIHVPSLEELNVEKCPLLLVPTINAPAVRGLQMKRQTCGFTLIDTSEIEVSGVSELKQIPVVPVNLYLTKCDHVESLLEEEVLQVNMDKLRIYDCCFSRSPSKVGIPSTLRLLTISNCTKVDLLLHQLFRCHHPALQNLFINGGTYDSTLPLSFSVSEIFPSLTYFGIYRLEGLEKLCIFISEGHTSSLRNLEINGCSDLVHVQLPGLEMSHRISHCSKLRQMVHTHSSLQKLTLEQCPGLLFPGEGLPSGLHELQIWFCNKLTSHVDWNLQRLSSLAKFTIMGGCEDVEIFPKESLLPSSLTSLSIYSLPNLKSLHGIGLQQLSSLVKLHITRCSELQSLTGSVFQHLVSLKEIKIHACRRLRSLTEAGLHYLTALETLDIQGCRELQSLTRERLPGSVSCLIVDLCPLLEQQCEFEKGAEWCYISHIPKILINNVLF